ncbi:MAG TPA: hypothetical protein VML75_09765 [Kofleriaceae bacterium]|nr:hypothetical protein [Kofleriaceae bacterium]
MKRMGFIIAACALQACGGAGARTVVEPRQLDEASGAPSVSKVTDLGEMGLIPAQGNPLPPADSDGVFAVGELVLIEGSDFGKLPTVNIGGRPAEVRARTGGGGIVTRIPAGVPTGDIEVEVSHTRGRGAKGISAVRYGLVVQPGAGVVHVLRFGPKGELTVTGALQVPGARDVAITHDGVAGYVVADAAGEVRSAALAVIALTASGGPKVLRSLRLSGTRGELVTTAGRSPRGVVIGGGRVTVFDSGNATSPALYDAVSLPQSAGGAPTAAAMLQDGTLAVVLSAEDNSLLPIDLTNPAAARPRAPLELLPGERVPLVRDLGFAPKGEELWVVAGDNQVSLIGGQHAPRLIILKVSGGNLALERTVGLGGVDAPLALAVARRESIGSATAIRSMARRAAIIATSVDRAVLEAMRTTGSPDAALAQPQPLGHLARTDLEGKSEQLWRDEVAVTDVELTEDVRYIVSAGSRVTRSADGLGYELGVAITPLAGGSTAFQVLGQGAAGTTLLSRAAIALSP